MIGAQVFRYYPYVAGEFLPEGTELLQITANPELAATAPVGDSLIGDVGQALRQLTELIRVPADRQAPAPLNRDRKLEAPASAPLTANAVYEVLSTVKPADSALVMESTSTMAEQQRWLPTTRSAGFTPPAVAGSGGASPPRSASRSATAREE